MKDLYDIFIIGGGINGAGIARDAAGRGLKVFLADKGKVGSATSSWSTKLIHGGLRYLENYDFKLVRESLKEREIIHKIAPHITRPVPFVIPYNNKIRSKWLIKIGLFIYDNIGGKTSLPRSSTINIKKKYPNILKNNYAIGFEYTDLQVDDLKLAQINAEDAKKHSAIILENRKVISAKRSFDKWSIQLDNNEFINARILINASGPWINEVMQNVINISSKKTIRLVKGSHIITKKLYENDIAFTLQNKDNRIIFVIPYKNHYSLIGTTEIEVKSPENLEIDNEEIEYLIDCVNTYFKNQVSRSDIVDKYAGIRPLIENYKQASKITRDYVFDLDKSENKAPLLNIFGGKLTTYRKLAENSLKALQDYLPENTRKTWTSKKIL